MYLATLALYRSPPRFFTSRPEGSDSSSLACRRKSAAAGCISSERERKSRPRGSLPSMRPNYRTLLFLLLFQLGRTLFSFYRVAGLCVRISKRQRGMEGSRQLGENRFPEIRTETMRRSQANLPLSSRPPLLMKVRPQHLCGAEFYSLKMYVRVL